MEILMTRKYVITESFATLQGEGLWAGRRAVFLRFAGCNMWNGKPEDRDQGQGACAQWCDTNFAEGVKLSLEDVMMRIEAEWGPHPYGDKPDNCRMVVCTGGEPTLQLDVDLVNAMHAFGWYVAIETNGTRDADVLRWVDHVCVSPKKGSVLKVWKAHELKVVLPGGVAGAPEEHQWSPAELANLGSQGAWTHKFVQPQDVTNKNAVEQTYLHAIRLGATAQQVGVADAIYRGHLSMCMRWIEENPGWRLSLQQHKYIGLR